MVIKFKCSGCGKGYKIRDDQAGEQIECPECDTLMIVPQAGTDSSSNVFHQRTSADSWDNKIRQQGAGSLRNRKSTTGGNRRLLLIGAGISVVVVLLGGLVFLLLPGENAEDVSGENLAAAASPTSQAEPAPPVVDMIGTAPARPPQPQSAAGVAPVQGNTAPGFDRYAGGQEEIKLPGVMKDLVAGGGGRFLVLYLKQQRQIAIYDANEVKIVKTIPLETDDALIAAGAEDFVVADRTGKKLERWSFASLQKEAETPLPDNTQLKQMALGYASQGPLMLYLENETDKQNQFLLLFCDLETLQDDPAYDTIRLAEVSAPDLLTFRASGDGTVFTLHNPRDGDFEGLFAVNRKPLYSKIWKFGKNRNGDTYGNYNLPDWNGSLMLTESGPYSQAYQYRGFKRGGKSVVPSTHANFYVSHPMESNSVDIFLAESGEKIASTVVGPLGKLSDEISPRGNAAQARKLDDLISLEKRVHYIYQADQIVTIPFSDDALRIVPFSLVENLDKAKEGYLFASSVSPQLCIRGSQLDYQLEFKSSSPSVTIELSAAPEGMQLSETGRLTWQVPETFEDNYVYVIITLYSEDQQMAFQVFQLFVQDEARG
ncbi:hypothetical protein [Gimesia maris]|uniref:hypothetical protein n=1 Tax=Gimesia maris TaxID=122 RepID=UPI0030DAC345|tara:strand:- start:35834 stop:37633 length:1800 start_codon:yes stop_codon:yes gene_type:complete